MTAAELYIALTLLVLAIIALAAMYTRKSKRPKHPPSKLAMVAILLVISGIIFGENRYIGYSLLGAGVLLSILDILKNLNRGT
jgi:MFS superfamily sulfate permease-like transporter